MNRIMQFAVIAVALAAMAAAQATPPPASPAPPATPAPPKARTAPRAPGAPAAPVAPVAPAKSYSYLGVDIRDVTSDRAAALKLKEPRGVEITLVDRDAPAGKAGLKEHDVILSYNGRNLQSGEELRKLIRETPPGQTVELGISRDGKPMTVKAQLADKHQVVVMKDYKIVVPNIRIPHIEVPIIAAYGRRHGVVVESLTSQLGEVFGVKNGEGVLVRSVEKGTPGDTAGLRAGDVIVRVGSERVEGTSDWNRLMREQKPGPVQIGIVREKRQQTVSLTVPERSAERSSARAFRMEGFDHDMDGLNLNMDGLNLDMEDFGNSLDELNRLQPEIDRAMRDTQERIQRDLERNQREWQRDAERAQKEAQREAERARREAQREAERARRQAQRDLEQAQRDLERSQREMEREQQKEQEKPEQPEKPPQPAQPPQPPPS